MNKVVHKTEEVPIFVIRPTRGLHFLDVRELWYYRELIYFLTWRDIKVRYKQTAVGIVWAVLQPLAMMVVFTLFFGRLANMPTQGDVPYPLFALAALVPWQLFSRTMAQSTSSLVTDQRLITRVYFPRIIVPTASVLAGMVDLAITLCLLFIMMFIYGYVPGIESLWLLFFILLMMITVLGIGFWLSALNLEFRDVMYAMPFLTQFMLFLTPVVYPSTIVPQSWRFLYGLNPMVGVIDGFRWSLFGVGTGLSLTVVISTCISLVLFFSGIIWFRHRERTFIDVVGSGGR